MSFVELFFPFRQIIAKGMYIKVFTKKPPPPTFTLHVVHFISIAGYVAPATIVGT